MIIKHKLKMEMTGMAQVLRVEVMQHEQMSRILELSLQQNGIPAEVSPNCKVVIQYQKPDGEMCSYDTLDDGENAWYISGNTIGATLLPEVCDTAGTTILTLKIVEGEQILFTFPVEVSVKENAVTGMKKSSGYLAGFLPQPQNAKLGEYLSVADIDGKGRVIRTKSVPIEAARGSEGESAYEIAVRQGFKGTETDWLESLVGPQGPTGPIGATGVPGPQGADGVDGKSAYEYAKDGGYVGTEEEFAERLALETLVGTTAEITPTQVKVLMDAGRPFAITHTDNNYGSMLFNSFVYSQAVGSCILSSTVFQVANVTFCAQLFGDFSSNTWTFSAFELVDKSDLPTAFYVTVDPATESVDKTDSEIEAAYQAGKPIYCLYPYIQSGASSAMRCPLSAKLEIEETVIWMFSMVGLLPFASNAVAGYIMVMDGKATIVSNTLANLNDIPTIPTALKNPNALTFTGAVTATYDGSVAKTVNIPAVPSALKNPKALTINGTSYDGSAAVDMKIESGDTVPDYVRTEAERVAKVVQSRQNANTLTFIAASDFHYSSVVSTAVQQKESMTHMGQAMSLLRNMVHIDFTVGLGDMVWDSGETVDQAMAAMRFVSSCLYDSGIGHLRARGNHDCLYSNDTGLTDAQIFANVGAWNSGAVYDPDHRLGGYCYRDFEDQKLRVICLNSSETNSGGCLFSAAQVAWLTGALDLTEKGNDWRSILFSHHPLDWGRDGGGNPIPAVNSAEGVIAAFHGHIHNFKVDNVTGTSIKRIAIPNACYGRENEYTTAYNITWGEDTKYTKTPGTAEDTSFCVITIDPEVNMIYADHYGAGYSRIIPYDGQEIATYTVTNNLTNVNTSNSGATISEGAAYSATLAANAGYTLIGGTVTVTMGGTDVTSSAYSDGKISITSVTGNIVITAVAAVEETGPAYTNQVTTSIDTDGSVYNGTGYQEGYRLNSSGTTTALANAVNSGFIPYNGEVIRVYGTANGTVGNSGNYVVMYDASFTKTLVLGMSNLVDYGAGWSQLDGKYMLTIDPAAITNAATKTALAEAAYIRCSLVSCTGANFMITLDEVIG